MGVLVDGTPTDVEDTISDVTVTLTVGDGSDETSDGGSSVSENPKTMDTNTVLIGCIIIGGLAVVLISKKRLSKIEK